MNELMYQITMATARAMQRQGLISEEDYSMIDVIFIEKYNPEFGVLYSENQVDHKQGKDGLR